MPRPSNAAGASPRAAKARARRPTSKPQVSSDQQPSCRRAISYFQDSSPSRSGRSRLRPLRRRPRRNSRSNRRRLPRRASPPRSRPARSGPAAAADVPRRHQPRSRRLHRHRQEGAAGDGPPAGRLPGVGGRRAAGGDVVQVVQDRRAEPDDPRAADSNDASTKSPRRSAPDVRLFSFFLDDYHVRRGNAMRARIDLAHFVRNEVAPQDMVSIMYPLEPLDAVVLSRDHENLARALERFDGRKYDYTPRNQYEDEYANYPVQTIEQIRHDVSLSAHQRADHQARRPARGQEGARARQRGLLQLHPAADAEHQRAGARPGQRVVQRPVRRATASSSRRSASSARPR